MAPYTLTARERDIYRRYASLALPRHTSYPTAPAWRADYNPGDFRADLHRSAEQARPLSVYVHIPYCERLCYYCACTKEIVPAARRQESDPAEPFLAGLEREADRFADLVGGSPVHQVHLGGGSPTFLTSAQLQRLWEVLSTRFPLAPGAETAVEVDPRITRLEQLETLRSLGFNRVSLGVQDFAPVVQHAVNRHQPFELVEQVVGWCRQLGFPSVNFDLIYGLPFQTMETTAATLEQVIALAPDRIAFYRLAVIPEMFRWQNAFRRADLPTGELSLDLNLLAINRFTEAGYEFIGLDHFARPGEGLGRARHSGTLHRNFQGMTTGKELDLLGLGPSAISQLDGAFAQNTHLSTAWAEAVRRAFATERGIRLSTDDRVRREVLQQLYGHGVIAKRGIEGRFGIAFDDYFADEASRLRELSDQGLVTLGSDDIRLTEPLGRLLVRVAAAVFDRFLPRDAFREGLSAFASKVG
jgi:oxygen-independent coproporphyrinogen-3 oxidase